MHRRWIAVPKPSAIALRDSTRPCANVIKWSLSSCETQVSMALVRKGMKRTKGNWDRLEIEVTVLGRCFATFLP